MRKLNRTSIPGFRPEFRPVLPLSGSRLHRWAAGLLLGGAALGCTALDAGALNAQTVEAPAASAPAAPAAANAETSAASDAASSKAETRRAKAREARAAREAKAREAKERAEKARAEKALKEKEKAEQEKAEIALKAQREAEAARQKPEAKPATVSIPSPAAPRMAAPAAQPPANVAEPASAQNRDVLPRYSGFALVMGLGALWLILRGRSRWSHRPKEKAPPAANRPPAPVKRQKAAPAKAAAKPTGKPTDTYANRTVESPVIARVVEEAEAISGIPWTRDMQPEPLHEPLLLPPLSSARISEAVPDIMPRAVPEIAPALPIFSPVAEERPAPESRAPSAPEPATDPAPRTVFKASALFSQIEPEEPAPVAQPEPPGPEFPTVRFEVQRLALSMSWLELRFTIHLRNETLDLVDPLHLSACMGTTQGDLPDTAQEHAVSRMLPGQTITIAGEWRVPLATLPSLRIGAVRLFVGAARIVAVSTGAPGHPQRESTFLIGLPEEGGKLAPIPLDDSARIYDNLAVQSIAAEQV